MSTHPSRLPALAMAILLIARATAAHGASSAERITAAEQGLPAFRVHNARFYLPANWEPPGRGSARWGIPVIYPNPYPNGHIVRYDPGDPQPGEQGALVLAQQYLAEKRKEFGSDSVVELSPADHRKHPRGYDMVVQHLTMPEQGTGTMHFVVAHLTSKYRGQTMWLKASKPELLARYRADFHQIVDSVVLLSGIELTPEVAELGSVDLYDVYRMQDYFEWLLDARFTDAHRARVGGHLIDTWRKGDRDTCLAIATTLADFEQIRFSQAPEATLARVTGRVQALQRWRAEAKAGDPRARLMLEIYHASQPPLAGTAHDYDAPPLTRHTSDATFRTLAFMAAKVANPCGGIGADAKPRAESLDAWAQQLAGAYGSLEPDARRQLAEMPLITATLEYTWPKLSAEERQALIAQWKQLPFIAQLADTNRADHQHLRDLQAIFRGYDAQRRLEIMGAYRLPYWKW